MRSSGLIPHFWLTAWLLTLPSIATAHPEGFSGLRIEVEPESIRGALTLHTRDLGDWFPPGKYTDYVNQICRELERTAEEVLELQIDEKRLAPSGAKAFQVEVGLIELDVNWQLPPPTIPAELLVWSKHLVLLPRGHQQLLFIEERRQVPKIDAVGILLLEDILTVERDAGVAELTPNPHLLSPLPESPNTSPNREHNPSKPLRAPITPSPGESPRRINFFVLGIEHILTGYDHLLFLAALLLTCASLSEAASIITCFTVAHSLTLALAALDMVHLSAGVVEPAIAASIVYVAVENLLFMRPALWRRVVITFLFGLIHGLGFATVLRDIGLGTIPGGVLWPLVQFNLGVEAGQLAVAALFSLALRWARKQNALPRGLVIGGSCLIGLCGAYWLVIRLASQVWSS